MFLALQFWIITSYFLTAISTMTVFVLSLIDY